MKTMNHERGRLLATAAVMVFIILLAVGSIAGAQTQPNVPPVSDRLVAPAERTAAGAAPQDFDDGGTVWSPVFVEGFEEEDFMQKALWYANVDFANSGYQWASRALAGSGPTPESQRSAWAIGGGSSGSNLIFVNPNYPGGVNTWLIAGPFDLTSAEDVKVTVDLFYEANKGDKFIVGVTENILGGTISQEFTVNENVEDGSWQEVEVPLSAYAGKPIVYVLFGFESAQEANKLGALIDNVAVWGKYKVQYLPYVTYGLVPPTPTPDPATPTATPIPPTSTPQPGGDYRADFTNDLEGWKPVRWREGTAYEFIHNGGEDAGRTGFLELTVNTKDDHYVMVSPVVAAKAPPYTIKAVSKLRSERNTGDKFGLVFGADYGGGECPVTNFSTCFNNYYQMLVRYQYDNGSNQMYVRLYRVEGHDSSNAPQRTKLIDWNRVRDIDEKGFVKWEILVSPDGTIRIEADDVEVATTTDTKFINNPYFGYFVETGDPADASTRVDNFEVK